MDSDELFAWIGEDELGSGEVGIKQGFNAHGLTALVSMSQAKVSHAQYLEQLQAQANHWGVTIRLARFRYVEDVMTITPHKKE